jgi:hypothetical protein
VAAQYHINREDEFVALRFDGDVDLFEVRELCQTLLTDPDFNPNWPQLADMRGIELKLTHGAMRQFLDYATSTYRPRIAAPIAFVLDGSKDDAFCAGVFRFVCGLSDAEVFDDYALAIKWLLKNGWPNQTAHDLAQPQDSGRNYPDTQPKQIRA